jgi:ketosteroid isomerase-like protein
MISRARWALLLLTTVACFGANESPRRASADEIAIRSARIAQNAAIAAGNGDSAATFWTEDVEIRRGLGQLIVGREGYRQLITPTGNRDSALVYQRDPASINVSAKWPLAFETGKWFAHLGSATGQTVIGGNYSAQWVKRGGRWLIRGELFVALDCAGSGCAYAAAP